MGYIFMSKSMPGYLCSCQTLYQIKYIHARKYVFMLQLMFRNIYSCQNLTQVICIRFRIYVRLFIIMSESMSGNT